MGFLPKLTLGGGLISSVIASIVMQLVSRIIERPLIQKLESTGWFNLDGWDIVSQYGEDLVEKARKEKANENVIGEKSKENTSKKKNKTKDKKQKENVEQDVSKEQNAVSTPESSDNEKQDEILTNPRNQELNALIGALRRNSNPCIIGPAGVGKTALVESLADYIANDPNAPSEIKNWKIIKIDFPSLIVGKGYGGSSSDGIVRLRALFEYAVKNPNVVIFIDEVHQFSGFADLCKTFMDRGQLKLIGATTTIEYNAFFEHDQALARRFTCINIDEPDPSKVWDIVKSVIPKLERKYSVKISEQIAMKNIELVNRYVPFKTSPAKEIKNLESACELASRGYKIAQDAKIKNGKKPEIQPVVELTEAHLREALSSSSKIPISAPTEEEMKHLMSLSAILKHAVIAQDSNIDRICEKIFKARFEYNDPSRIRGSFLFAGPSGVGKTYLSSLILNESASKFCIDASQFEKGLRSKLIASVNSNPYSTIVFEGIDKAKPEIVNEIFSIIDRGYAMSDAGQKVNFKNTVIILTINTGDINGHNEDEMQKYLKSRLGSENLSKIDDVLIFKSLDENNARSFVEKVLEGLSSFVSKASAGKSALICDESATNKLISILTNPDLGFRKFEKFTENVMYDLMMLWNGIAEKDLESKNIALKIDNDKLAFELRDKDTQTTQEIAENPNS